MLVASKKVFGLVFVWFANVGIAAAAAAAVVVVVVFVGGAVIISTH